MRHLLCDEPVTFLICWHGNGLALGFKGDDEAALQRCYNWAENMRVTNGVLLRTYQKGSIWYVITTMKQIEHGLSAQFRIETILNNEVMPLRDEVKEWEGDGDELGGYEVKIEYDEGKIDEIVRAKTAAFIKDRLVHENFMAYTPLSTAPVYELGAPMRSAAGGEE